MIFVAENSLVSESKNGNFPTKITSSNIGCGKFCIL